MSLVKTTIWNSPSAPSPSTTPSHTHRVVVVSCDERGKLSDEVTKYNTGDDAPYRMAMHPSGRSLVLGMTRGGVQGVDLQPSTSGRDAPELSRPGGKAWDAWRKAQAGVVNRARIHCRAATHPTGSFASRAPSIGALKCLSFSSDGRLLVMGGEDGSVRIVHWPSLEPKLDWQASEDKAIRAADLSRAHSDGILTTTDEAGMAALWNAETGDKVLQLAVPQGEEWGKEEKSWRRVLCGAGHAACGSPAPVGRSEAMRVWKVLTPVWDTLPPQTRADMPRATFFKCIALAEGAGPAIYAAVKWKGEGHILRWRQLASGEIRLEVGRRRSEGVPGSGLFVGLGVALTCRYGCAGRATQGDPCLPGRVEPVSAASHMLQGCC